MGRWRRRRRGRGLLLLLQHDGQGKEQLLFSFAVAAARVTDQLLPATAAALLWKTRRHRNLFASVGGVMLTAARWSLHSPRGGEVLLSWKSAVTPEICFSISSYRVLD